MSLEQLAQDLFYEYCRKESTPANWKYLNSSRKVAWMEEILLIWSNILDNLKSTIKIESTSPQSNIYSLGYNDAVKIERMRFISVLEQMNTDFKNQLENFIDKNKD